MENFRILFIIPNLFFFFDYTIRLYSIILL